MTALMLTMLLLMVSFAVDLGRLRAERRDVQADADAIALDAVQKIGGLTSVDALAAAITEANLSAARNDFPATLTAAQVQVGTWDVPTQTFTPTTDPFVYPDAVRVDLSSTIPMFFDLSQRERSVSRRRSPWPGPRRWDGSGRCSPGSSCSIPRRTARDASTESQVAMMNYVYSAALGIEVSGGVEGSVTADSGEVPCAVTGPSDGLRLDALSYRGLADAMVSLGDLAAQMNGASPDQLVSSRVNAGDVFNAAADAIDANGNVADAGVTATLRSIAAAVGTKAGSTSEFDFGAIIAGRHGQSALAEGQGGTGNGAAADATINLLQLLTFSAVAIDGNNFVGLEMPIDLGAFGVGTVTPDISVIEKPQIDAHWKNPGETGPQNSQIRVGVDVPLSGIPLDLGLLGVAGLGGVTSVHGHLPLTIEVARADSLYQRIACSPQGVDGSVVDMLVNTGAVTVNLAGANGASSSLITDPITLPLPGLGLLGGVLNVTLDLAAVTNVTGSANLLGASETHTFTAPYATPMYRYSGGVSGTEISDATFNSITYNAVSGTTLTKLLLAGVTQAAINNMITQALKPVMAQVLDTFIDQLLASLGVTMAGADGQILDVRCSVPALADRG